MGSKLARKTGRAGRHSAASAVGRARGTPAPSHPILQLQRTIGNQAVSGLLQSGRLRVSRPGDTHEREADRVADQVMRMPDPQARHQDAGGEQGLVQAEEVAGASAATAARGGQPLSDSLRSYFEPRFGQDFSDVRVHSDRSAAEAARAVNARAFTAGRDIVFGEGQYTPNTTGGKRLLAHELTHVVQQTKDSGQRGSRSASTLTARIQRQEPTREQRAEFEADRERFAREQDKFFEQVGQNIRDQILAEAKFHRGTQPTSAAEALRVVNLWGLSIDDIVGHLPRLGKSLSTRALGVSEGGTLKQQSDQLVASMNNLGKETFRAMLVRVRAEPFWRDWLDNHAIFIFPDLSGKNLYSGYTQRSSDRWDPAFIIHINKDTLEAGQTDAVVATLVHELSHTTFEPSITERALKPFLQQLASLLADHPDVRALRTNATDQNEAREDQVRQIRQILYEQTAYAEEEIFVHLQQLTHQPPIKTKGGTIQPHIYILAIVEDYINRLKNIRMAERTLFGILDSLERRVRLLYDRRIRFLPKRSRERRLMELSKNQAVNILKLARSETSTD